MDELQRKENELSALITELDNIAADMAIIRKKLLIERNNATNARESLRMRDIYSYYTQKNIIKDIKNGTFDYANAKYYRRELFTYDFLMTDVNGRTVGEYVFQCDFAHELLVTLTTEQLTNLAPSILYGHYRDVTVYTKKLLDVGVSAQVVYDQICKNKSPTISFDVACELREVLGRDTSFARIIIKG